MHIAFVENAQDDVHREDSENEEDAQARQGFLEDQGFSLHAAVDIRWKRFGGGLFDEFCDIANGHPGNEIETEGNRRKLVDVIHRLRPDDFFPTGDCGKRHQC